MLDEEVRIMAQIFVNSMLQMPQLDANEAAVLSIYIAWYLLEPDDSVANFLADLSETSEVVEDDILDLYRQLYPNQMRLIRPEMLPGLFGSKTEGILALLPAPDAENGSSNRGDESDGEGSTSGETSLHTADALETREQDLRDHDEISEHSTEEGGRPNAGFVVEVSDRILDNMRIHSVLTARDRPFREAVCTFMAFHILGSEASYSEIASVHGIDESRLREDYAHVFPRRHELVGSEVAEHMGRDDLERALEAFPALNWPPLEDSVLETNDW